MKAFKIYPLSCFQISNAALLTTVAMPCITSSLLIYFLTRSLYFRLHLPFHCTSPRPPPLATTNLFFVSLLSIMPEGSIHCCCRWQDFILGSTLYIYIYIHLPVGSAVKNLPANAGDTGLIPESGTWIDLRRLKTLSKNLLYVLKMITT